MNHGTVDHAPVYAREVMRRALKISVHDHLVVGRDGVASFKALGLF